METGSYGRGVWLLCLLAMTGCADNDASQTNYGGDWQRVDYEGSTNPPGYLTLTDSPLSQIRNDVYVRNGAYEREKCEPEQPGGDCDLERPVRFRPHLEKPRFKDRRVLEVRIDLEAAIEQNREPYRAQVNFREERFAPGYMGEQTVQEDAWGWDNWETAPGYELFVRFSLRVPSYNDTVWPPASPNGLDYPHFAANIFQIRHRFHNPPRNIPLHLVWKYDHIVLKSAWFDEAIEVVETPHGQWIDFLVMAECSKDNEGKGFEVWTRGSGEKQFKLRHAYRGPLYGTTEPGRVDVDRENLGFPSYGIYTSSRLVGDGLREVLAAGVSELGIEFSELEVRQVHAGSVAWPSVVEDSEREWPNALD